MTRHRCRSWVLGAVLACLVATLLVATPAAAGGGTADRPRTGYRIRADGTAAGGWFGSRTLSHRAVFRIDPRAKPRTPGFAAGAWMSLPKGSGPVVVDRWRVRRAAWLVSKYGTYDSASQAAAVQVALDALLHGGGYRVTGAATKRRLRQTGAASSILALARYMLADSTRRAGPYQVRVAPTGTVVGGQIRVSVEVTSSGGGEPVAHLPVEVWFDGRRSERTTDAAGVVTAVAAAGRAGPRPVTVVVSKVPSDRLFVRRPTRRGASRVVVAGRKITLTRRAEVAVQATPQVRVTAPDVRRITGPVPGTVHLADAYPSGRTAALTLHGPFAPDDPASCDPGLVAARRNLPVSADGGYRVPAVTVTEAGVYRWAVAVPADAYNTAAAACGQAVLLQAVPTLEVEPVDATRAPGTVVVARVRAGALPDSFSRVAIVRLYGPFATRDAVRCTAARQVRRREVDIVGPATTVRTAEARLDRTGLYAWRAALPATELTARAVTRCGAPGTVLRIR